MALPLALVAALGIAAVLAGLATPEPRSPPPSPPARGLLSRPG